MIDVQVLVFQSPEIPGKSGRTEQNVSNDTVSFVKMCHTLHVIYQELNVDFKKRRDILILKRHV